MVCHDLKFIYLHIPRTGGVSVERCFRQKIMDHRFPIDYLVNKDYFKATFVRNPWDRFVSIYHNRLLNFNHNLPVFSKWLIKLNPEEYKQTNWLLFENSTFVDFIGRFENLKQDFDKMCSLISVKKTLPHINTSEHYHYSVYYDSNTIKWVKDNFKEEIKMFDYSFSEPDKKKLITHL